MRSFYYNSPIGVFEIETEDDYILALKYTEKDFDFQHQSLSLFENIVKEQLDMYFEGKLKSFDLKLYFNNLSDFQKTVYKKLQKTAYGETISYIELASISGNKKASRVVGSFMAKNPFPIIVPCHRVIKSNGEIGNFAFGIEAKRFLIELEKCNK